MSTARGSSTVASSFSCWPYDVFLSFRGEDVRKNFIDHLYAALNQKGINVFRDDKELERGKSIMPGLFKAIEESRISVIVFSRNYASSTWCLDELVKIVECTNTSDHRHQQMVFPIFYGVEPTVVRKQTGSFQEAFSKHEEAFRENTEKVQKWRDALKEVANISGWELKDRNESEFIMDIVKEISNRIPTKFETLEQLVGVESRMDKLRFLMETRSDDVCMIGICGMGGIGKTTLARVVYDLFYGEFEASCFLANVRETSVKRGLISLQRQVLSQLLKLSDNSVWNVYDGMGMIRSRLHYKKVLIVVDDVVDVEQLESLAGKHDWFGPGSRIIITSRDEHLLILHGVDEVYKVEGLNYDDALKLFCMKAFKTNQPLTEYEQLANLLVEYASGLPLALKVLGSLLYGRPVDEWRSALERLKRDAEKGILDTLQIGFDGLQETEKEIFLDIACFFKGNDRDYVIRILDGCGFDPIIGIAVLVEKSLVTNLDDNKLWMHDLLQEMGQQIVKRQSSKEPGKRSRLWKGEDVCHMLTKNTGTNAVEGIILNHPEDTVHSCVGSKAFSKMTNLRLLKISNVRLPEGLDYLSNELRLLEWLGYPLKSFPSISQLSKTIELNISYSSIEQMWNGVKPLNRLKFMRLSHSQNLIRSPDFTGVPNLEELILDGCTSLCEIHPSLLVHKKLILLNLESCTSLKALPSKIAMESLKTLVLSRCSKLKRFPEIVGSMESLMKLMLDGTAIQGLPLSIELLSGLDLLNLNDCNNLVRLPSTINGLKSLKTLYLSGCSNLENVPENLGKVESLEELDLSGTAIRQPGSSIFLLKNLKAISFRGCKAKISSTSWYLRFPEMLRPRRVSDPMPLTLPCLSGLCSLKKLDLSDCNLREESIPSDICSLLSLEKLNLSGNNFELLPGTINHLTKLRNLKLEDCKRLKCLPELPSSVRMVRVNGCDSLETLSGALRLCKSKFRKINCVDCLTLFNDKDLVCSLLKDYLEEGSNPRPEYISLVVPGNKIPQWFSYQNEGPWTTIERPSDLYDKNKVVGYAICCVFHIRKHSPTVRHRRSYPTHQLNCHVRSDGIKGASPFFSIDFKEQFGQAAESGYLWLLYLSRHKHYDSIWQLESDEFKLLFLPRSSPGLEVKRCGVHPIYEHEVETFNQTKNQWTRSLGYNLNESHLTAVGSKRSLADYVAVEASGSGCCDDDADEEEAQAKRFRELE